MRYVYTLAVQPVLRTGCPTFYIHFQRAFSSLCFALLSQDDTFVQVRHSFFAISMLEEFILFSFHFPQSVKEQYFHDLTEARPPFVDLSSVDKAFAALLPAAKPTERGSP